MYTTVLVPIDLNDGASAARVTPAAIALARTHGARLLYVYIVPDMGRSVVGHYAPPGSERRVINEASGRLAEYVADNVPAGVEVEHVVGHGSIYREILRLAEAMRADLIMMAASTARLPDYLLGPNTAKVVRHAGCSVLVVR